MKIPPREVLFSPWLESASLAGADEAPFVVQLGGGAWELSDADAADVRLR